MFQNPSSPKKRPQPIQNDSILESIRDVGSSVGQTLGSDVFGKGANDALASLFGTPPTRTEQNTAPFSREQERAPVFSAQRDVITPERITREQNFVRQQLEVIRSELKMLAAAVKNLDAQVEQAIEDMPVDPGTYHINFLERLRTVLITLRQRVQDSESWLSLWSSRKQKKKYWGLYKKHGTKFGLSSERTAATQTA